MSSVLLKEIRNIALLTFAFGGVQFGIACAFGYSGLPMLYGTALGCAIAVVNFALMGIILEKSLRGKGAAQALTGVGYMFRLALIAAALIWSIKSEYLNWICTAIPLLFPRIEIYLINNFRKDKGEDERS